MRFANPTRFMALLASALALPVLAQDEPRETTGQFTWWRPPDISTHGHDIDLMFDIILYLTGFTCIAVFIAMIVFLIKYRYRKGRQATFIHGNNKLETVWTLVPTIIMALVATFSQSSWSKAKYVDQFPDDAQVIRVNVVAKQFAWYFHYQGADGVFGQRLQELVDRNASEPEKIIGLDRSSPGAADDIVVSSMVVPVGRPIICTITSVDVLHSFFLPNFRVKQDAVPGMQVQVWFEATKTSDQVIGSNPNSPMSIVDAETYERINICDNKPFDIVCAELCGQGHYKMKGQLYVVTESQYDQWSKVAQKNATLSGDDDNEE